MGLGIGTEEVAGFGIGAEEVGGLAIGAEIVFEAAGPPPITAFTVTPDQISSGDWTSRSVLTLAWDVPAVRPGVYPELQLTARDEAGTVTRLSTPQEGASNVTTPAPREDYHYGLSAAGDDGTNHAAADYEYDVAASIQSFAATEVTGGEAQRRQLFNLSGSFTGHTLVEATVTHGAHTFDLLSLFTGAGRVYKHLNGAGAPTWVWTIRTEQATRQGVGYTGTGSPNPNYEVTLRVRARFGPAVTASDTITVPA